MDDQLPDQIHLEATNRQYIVLGAVSALFVIMLTALRGSSDIATYDVNVWLTVFFAIITLIAASAALFKRRWLTLDQDGFETNELRTLGKVAWDDVSEFRTYVQRIRGMPATHQVAFELVSKEKRFQGRLAGLMLQGTIRITERYRVSGAKLAETMNAFRDRAMSQPRAAA